MTKDTQAGKVDVIREGYDVNVWQRRKQHVSDVRKNVLQEES